MPLYKVQDPSASASSSANSSMEGFGALRSMAPQREPGKTIGGGIMSAGGGAMAGASLGGLVTTAGTVHPGFAIAGAAFGAASYFLG